VATVEPTAEQMRYMAAHLHWVRIKWRQNVGHGLPIRQEKAEGLCRPSAPASEDGILGQIL
jgi:hypothetical protein